MSEPQLPREVWGLLSIKEQCLIAGGSGSDDIAAFASRGGAQGCILGCGFIAEPVLLGGSALLDEVKLLREENAKLREVAEAASIVVDETMPDEPSDAMLSNHPHWHLFAALANAGYPKE